MNPRIKQLWVNALRAGDYQQGIGQLRTKDDKFCCLGVLCNIYAQEHPDEVKDQFNKEVLFDKSALPPGVVVEWADLDCNDPDVCFNKKTAPLSSWNDYGKTFKQIANMIEKNL
jgi:hypothetical protein